MRFPTLSLAAAALASAFLTGCVSTDELARKLDQRNDAYLEHEQRREMRSEARDERYEAWVDRLMD